MSLPAQEDQRTNHGGNVMADNTLILLGILWLICGVISGSIAANKGASFSAFFFIGLILGVIGIIIAAVAKAPPKPGGWYRDPWDARMIRWHDGRDWTPNTMPAPIS